MKFLVEGDTLVVTKLDRLGRNTLDMLTLIADLGKRGVKFMSLAEPWANTDSPGRADPDADGRRRHLRARPYP